MGIIHQKKVVTMDFATIVKPHLDELSHAIRVSLNLTSPSNEKDVLASYMTPIKNIQAHAAESDYTLISGLAVTVLDFLENVKRYDRKVVQIVDLLYKTTLLIMARKILGDGGAEGHALQGAFLDACQKTMKKIQG